jgi:hypothetical protein
MVDYPPKNHSPSGDIESHHTGIHGGGMKNHSPSAFEPHPEGPSVDTEDRGGAHHVPHVPVPGPRVA